MSTEERREVKKKLRREVLARRAALTEPERERGNLLITERILGHQWYYLSDTILGYVSNGSEVSTTEIVKRFEEDHNQFFLGIESEDEYYSQWFSEMLKQLEEGELPYAFSDYYNDPDYWQTNTGKKIKTLN